MGFYFINFKYTLYEEGGALFTEKLWTW